MEFVSTVKTYPAPLKDIYEAPPTIACSCEYANPQTRPLLLAFPSQLSASSRLSCSSNPPSQARFERTRHAPGESNSKKRTLSDASDDNTKGRETALRLKSNSEIREISPRSDGKPVLALRQLNIVDSSAQKPTIERAWRIWLADIRKRIAKGEDFDSGTRTLLETHDDETILEEIKKRWRKPFLDFMMGMTYGRRPSWRELLTYEQGDLNSKGVYGLFIQWASPIALERVGYTRPSNKTDAFYVGKGFSDEDVKKRINTFASCRDIWQIIGGPLGACPGNKQRGVLLYRLEPTFVKESFFQPKQYEVFRTASEVGSAFLTMMEAGHIAISRACQRRAFHNLHARRLFPAADPILGLNSVTGECPTEYKDFCRSGEVDNRYLEAHLMLAQNARR